MFWEINMKKIVLMFLLFSLSLPVFSSDWVQISENSYVDKDNISEYVNKYEENTHDKFSFFVKSFNDKSANFLYLEKSYKKEVKYQISKFAVDCSNKTISTQEITSYDNFDNVVNKYHAPYLKFAEFAPNSASDKYYSYVCSVK